ncbi:MAG TPA: excalibur calcium-binding domain-containing protein, partial [Pilimelia sp.]|nr:excalibur calcium-binding domain-containing protein [Pilimelia sp.]
RVVAAPTGRVAAPSRRAVATGPRAVFYSTCAQVRAAGKAPLRPSDPGFRIRLDTDRDGLACEPRQAPAGHVPAG